MSSDELLCAALQHRSAPWPDAPQFTVENLLKQVRLHGIGGLLVRMPAVRSWPVEVQHELRRIAMGFAVWELRHQETIRCALRRLTAVGAAPVLIKGTALAYGLYEDPALRFRSDTDVIIDPSMRLEAHQALIDAGFELLPSAGGEHLGYQATYRINHADTGQHCVDLHWKINNSEVLSRLFTHAELASAAKPLPRLAPEARAAGEVHALLLACMHRASHKQNALWFEGEAVLCPDRLIWLADIHLLAAHFSKADWREVLAQARTKSLLAVTHEGLERASAAFGPCAPAEVLVDFRLGGQSELPYRYMEGSKLQQQWLDFRALESAQARFALLREVFFPPASYMHQAQGVPPQGSLWLPYLKRATRGLGKALSGRPTRTADKL